MCINYTFIIQNITIKYLIVTHAKLNERFYVYLCVFRIFVFMYVTDVVVLICTISILCYCYHCRKFLIKPNNIYERQTSYPCSLLIRSSSINVFLKYRSQISGIIIMFLMKYK